MQDKEITKVTLDMTEEMSSEGRQDLLLKLLRQQNRLSQEEPAHTDNCSLIDLRTGKIVGSGICPKCRGWVGRAEQY